MRTRWAPRTPALALLLVALTWGGCRRDGPAVEPDHGAGSDADTTTTAGADATADDGGAVDEALDCGVGLRFAELDWVPADARLLTLVELDHGDLDAALALLAQAAVDRRLTLPVLAAIDYQNLGMQLGNLRWILAQFGFAPEQIVEVQGPDGELAWTWAISCHPEQIGARTLARWQIALRVDLEHPGVRLGAGDPAGFPFDIVLIADRQVVLTMAGRGRAVSTWLAEAGRDDSSIAPGTLASSLEAAPIRSVLRGEWLLAGTAAPAAPAGSPGAGAADPEQAHIRTLRVTATALEVDGTPWSAP